MEASRNTTIPNRRRAVCGRTRRIIGWLPYWLGLLRWDCVVDRLGQGKCASRCEADFVTQSEIIHTMIRIRLFMSCRYSKTRPFPTRVWFFVAERPSVRLLTRLLSCICRSPGLQIILSCSPKHDIGRWLDTSVSLRRAPTPSSSDTLSVSHVEVDKCGVLALP